MLRDLLEPLFGQFQYEVRRIPLPRRWVNKPWALLRASPIHTVYQLLRLGGDLIEVHSQPAVVDGHRVAFDVLQDDIVGLISLVLDYLMPGSLLEDIHAVGPTLTGVVFRQVFDEASYQTAEVRRIRVEFLSASTAAVLLPTASLASNDLQALSPLN